MISGKNVEIKTGTRPSLSNTFFAGKSLKYGKIEDIREKAQNNILQ